MCAGLLLAACGGGSGNDAATGPGSFPLRAAYKSYVAKSDTTLYDIKGDCTGNAVISKGAPAAASFQGVSALAVVVSEARTLSGCPQAGTSTSGYVLFYDNDYKLLGKSVAGNTLVPYVEFARLPVGAKVGDSARLGNFLYVATGGVNTVATDAVSYQLEAGDAGSAIFNYRIDYDGSAETRLHLSTEQQRYRITAEGTLTPVSIDIEASNPSRYHLVYTPR